MLGAKKASPLWPSLSNQDGFGKSIPKLDMQKANLAQDQATPYSCPYLMRLQEKKDSSISWRYNFCTQKKSLMSTKPKWPLMKRGNPGSRSPGISVLANQHGAFSTLYWAAANFTTLIHSFGSATRSSELAHRKRQSKKKFNHAAKSPNWPTGTSPDGYLLFVHIRM
jgi:hypothetical protein